MVIFSVVYSDLHFPCREASLFIAKMTPHKRFEQKMQRIGPAQLEEHTNGRLPPASPVLGRASFKSCMHMIITWLERGKSSLVNVLCKGSGGRINLSSE
jgi:hypothetical protein